MTGNRRTSLLVSALLTVSLVGILPGAVHLISASESSAYPVLNVGDSWRFSYAAGENSVETIARSESCGSLQCVVDAEVSAQWSDVVWRLPDWTIVKENYTDPTGSYFDTYSPPVRSYDWPLATGKQWTINSTITEVSKDSSGTHYSTFMLLRTRQVASETSLTVPAGTFNTFVVEEYKQGSLHTRRWLSYQAKDIVRWEQYGSSGQITDSSVLQSYRFLNDTPLPDGTSTNKILGLSPITIFEVIGSALIVAIVIAISAVVIERRRSSKRAGSQNPPY